MDGFFDRIEKAEKDAVIDLMNREQVNASVTMSADSIVFTATKSFPATTCKYCGSVIEGKRCESCGAPRQGE